MNKAHLPEQSRTVPPHALASPVDASGPQAPAGSTDAASGDNRTDQHIVQALGRNLRRLRIRQGLSLERLARLSGVSRAMLSQIELGRSVPTILLFNKVARALNRPLSALITFDDVSALSILRREDVKTLVSLEGTLSVRNLAPGGQQSPVGLEEIRLLPGAECRLDVDAIGTTKVLVVAFGLVEIDVAGERARLREGDTVDFSADRPHSLHNIGTMETVIYVATARKEGS